MGAALSSEAASGAIDGAIGGMVGETIAEVMGPVEEPDAFMKRMCHQAKATGQRLDVEKCLQLYQQQTVHELQIKADIGRLSASVVSALAKQDVKVATATANNAVENNFLILAVPLAADAFMAFLATPAGMALVATTMAITLNAAHKLGQHLKAHYQQSNIDAEPDNTTWTDQGLQTEQGKATVLDKPGHNGEEIVCLHIT